MSQIVDITYGLNEQRVSWFISHSWKVTEISSSCFLKDYTKRTNLGRTTEKIMCHWRIESALIPLFTIPSTIFMIISMTTKSWVIGHMQSDRNIAVRISPWYLCSNHCVLSGHDKVCVGSRVSAVKGIQCFWIHDWSASGFRKYIHKKKILFTSAEA